MNIIAGKTYKTRDDRKVNVIYTNMRNRFSVIGIVTKGTGCDRTEALISFTSEGKFYDDNRTSNLDLVEEYSIWNDVKRGTPVLVRDSCKDEWELKLFSEYKEGVPYVEDGWDKFYTLDSSTYIQKIGYMIPANIKLIENKDDKVLVNAFQLLGLIESRI